MGLEVAAIAALAATGAQMVASAEEHGAMDDAVQAELNRQKQFQKKATGVFSQSLGQSGAGTAQEQTQQGTNRLAQEYAKLAAAPLTTQDPYSPSATIPMNFTSAAGAKGAENTTASTGASAGGWNEWNMQQAIKDILTNSQLGVIGKQASISAQPLPYEIQQAGQSWDWLKMIGQMMSGAGMGYGLAGMGGRTSIGAPVANTQSTQDWAAGAGLYGTNAPG